MGGMINYVLSNEKYFKPYVVNYTNAPFVVDEKFTFNDGLFSGWNSKKKKYDKSSWAIKKDAKGMPMKDMCENWIQKYLDMGEGWSIESGTCQDLMDVGEPCAEDADCMEDLTCNLDLGECE